MAGDGEGDWMPAFCCCLGLSANVHPLSMKGRLGFPPIFSVWEWARMNAGAFWAQPPGLPLSNCFMCISSFFRVNAAVPLVVSKVLLVRVGLERV